MILIFCTEWRKTLIGRSQNLCANIAAFRLLVVYAATTISIFNIPFNNP